MEMESLAAFLAPFVCVNLSPQNTEQRLNIVEGMHKFVFRYLFTYILHVEMSVAWKLQNHLNYVAENMVVPFGRLLFSIDSV